MSKADHCKIKRVQLFPGCEHYHVFIDGRELPDVAEVQIECIGGRRKFRVNVVHFGSLIKNSYEVRSYEIEQPGGVS